MQFFRKWGKKMLKNDKRGRNNWKFGRKCTKSENILKKGRWFGATVAHNKLLEKAPPGQSSYQQCTIFYINTGVFSKLRSIGIICNVCRLNFINKFNAVASFENLGANIFLYFFYQWKVFIIFHKILFSLLFPPSYNPLLVDIPAYFVDFFCFLRHPSLELLSPLENGGMWLNHNIFCFLQNSCQFGGSCFQIIC